MNEKLFRKSSLEHLTSLEKLDTYVKVTTPRAWISVIGLLLLLISVGIWSSAVSLKTSVSVEGVMYENKLHVFLTPQQAEKLKEGMSVEAGGERIGEITGIIKEPVRREEAGKLYLTDYYRETKLDDWNVEVLIDVSNGISEGEEISCRIITDKTKIGKLILE